MYLVNLEFSCKKLAGQHGLEEKEHGYCCIVRDCHLHFCDSDSRDMDSSDSDRSDSDSSNIYSSNSDISNSDSSNRPSKCPKFCTNTILGE